MNCDREGDRSKATAHVCWLFCHCWSGQVVWVVALFSLLWAAWKVLCNADLIFLPIMWCHTRQFDVINDRFARQRSVACMSKCYIYLRRWFVCYFFMFWTSLLRLAIGVKHCLRFAGCAIAQLHGKRRQKCMYGQTNGGENEKSATRGIPRQSPIQVLTPPDRA